MTALQPQGGLAVAEIVFFSPALLVALFIVFRHGFSKQLGWIYIVILSLLRLIGASGTLYSEVNHDYSDSLLELIYITSAVGTTPLLLALLGFLARVHDGMKNQAANLPDIVFRGLSLFSLVALILAIVGGTDISDPSSASTGHALMEAAAICFLVLYLVLAAITTLTFARKSSAVASEHKLIDAALASLPFLLVRIIYTVAVSFSKNPGSIFYFLKVNIYVSAFMQFLMEAITVVIFITAGLMTPKRIIQPPSDVELRGSGASYEGNTPLASRRGEEMQQQPTYKQQPRQQQQRSIGDYRPSRLIMNAIKGR